MPRDYAKNERNQALVPWQEVQSRQTAPSRTKMRAIVVRWRLAGQAKVLAKISVY